MKTSPIRANFGSHSKLQKEWLRREPWRGCFGIERLRRRHGVVARLPDINPPPVDLTIETGVDLVIVERLHHAGARNRLPHTEERTPGERAVGPQAKKHQLVERDGLRIYADDRLFVSPGRIVLVNPFCPLLYAHVLHA